MATSQLTHHGGGAFGYSLFRNLSLSAATTGKIITIPNPEGVDLNVHLTALKCTTIATAAAVVDVGIGTTDARFDNLIDGAALHAMPVNSIYDNIRNVGAGANGQSSLDWPANSNLTVYVESGDANGFVGQLMVNYQPNSGGQLGFP